MELTNLVWHLGAFVAALWAAIAYRTLRSSSSALEEGVVESLLQMDGANGQTDDSSSSQALQRRRRSARARALRWYSEELLRRKGIRLIWQKDILEIPDAQWRISLAFLQRKMSEKNPAPQKRWGSVIIAWQGDAGKHFGWTEQSVAGDGK